MRNLMVASIVLVLALAFFNGKLSITQAPQAPIESEAKIEEANQKAGSNEAPTGVEPEEQKNEEDGATDVATLFPKKLTVLDVVEYNAAKVLKDPEVGAESIGSVFGSLMHVDVIEELDSGFTKISTWDYYSMKPIEGYVSTDIVKTIEARGEYKVLVSLDEQKTYIYKDDDLYKTFVNSTGLDDGDTYTPKGIYLIGDRGASFYSGKYQQGAYNWVRFNNNYLFHSVPFDENQVLIDEEADKLGQKASHGCIRHSIEDAQWFYDNIPSGTLVLIQDRS